MSQFPQSVLIILRIKHNNHKCSKSYLFFINKLWLDYGMVIISEVIAFKTPRYSEASIYTHRESKPRDAAG